MRVGILGSGEVGQALAKGLLAEGGHEVLLATRTPEGEKGNRLRKEFPRVNICNFAAAAAAAELAVLCTPWAAAPDALKLADAGDNLFGKILIDTNNAIRPAKRGVELVMGLETSAAEALQEWLPGSRIVKCWNTTGAANFYKPQFEQTPTMFLCGNDADAKAVVSKMVEAFGWQPFDAGALDAARELEPMAALWINRAMQTGSTHHAFKML